jgi:hypothetical protein
VCEIGAVGVGRCSPRCEGIPKNGLVLDERQCRHGEAIELRASAVINGGWPCLEPIPLDDETGLQGNQHVKWESAVRFFRRGTRQEAAKRVRGRSARWMLTR